MRVGSLFSGIGGIELGLERAGGYEVVWFVEWEPYAQAVLRKHWPSTKIYDDVSRIDWSTVEPIDVLTGGFPCQPHSVAGKRKASSDERDLWPECKRAIAALKPHACIFENVPGLLTSEGGDFFKHIINDFYSLGYRPCVLHLSAEAVGAPHKRERIFILAHAEGKGLAFRKGNIRIPYGPNSGSLPPQRGQVDWNTEPGMGRMAHGIPHRVDRIRCLGNAVVPQVAQAVGQAINQAERET